MMSHDEMIAVIQAAKEGKAIQARTKPKYRGQDWLGDDSAEWTNCHRRPLEFNFGIFEYRVKPEPREFWIADYGTYGDTGKRAATVWDHPVAKHNAHAILHVREVLE